MSSLSVDQARAIVEHAVAAALESGVPGASAVVIDRSTALRMAICTERASLLGFEIARAKALSALSFRSATLTQSETIGKNLALVAALSSTAAGRFMPVGGGVPVFDDSGALAGAAAMAGAAPDTDHRLIAAAVQAAGLRHEP